MPSTLPVPSKSALRTLRRLALGTSCTVAFSAGLLTEDRRRRISSAREVHDNARKIKGAKGYHHGSGRMLADIDEDNLMGFEEQMFLTADWTMRKLTKETNEAQKQSARQESQENSRTRKRRSANAGVATVRASAPSKRRIDHHSWGFRRISHSETQIRPATQTSTGVDKNAMHSMSTAVGVTSETQKVVSKEDDSSQDRTSSLVHGMNYSQDLRQEKNKGFFQPDSHVSLASNTYETILEADLKDVDTAVSRLLKALRKETEVLLDTAARLFKMCMEVGRNDLSQSILESLEQSQIFSPYTLIEHMLDNATENVPENPQVLRSQLEMACLFYLNGYKADVNIPPGVDLKQLVLVGKRLFQAIQVMEWHKLSHDMYFHIHRYDKDICKSATHVGYLISATHGIGDYRGVLDYFEKFYANCSPSFDQMPKVLRCVLEATVRLGSADKAVQVITIANSLAKSADFKLTTTPVLEFLGHQWTSTNDIQHTIQLFERLKPVYSNINHPGAVYGAIIQWCIEANMESIAQSYYNELEEFYTISVSDLRIFGHFAFAKALRKDWAGVEQDLLNMATLITESGGGIEINLSEAFTNSFTPILKLFAQSHTLTQTEKFVFSFLESNSLLLTPYISNIMIDQYVAAKEITSLLRWIETAKASGCSIGSVSINIILKHCRTTWNFSFEETCQMYQMIFERGGHTDSQILRQLVGSPGGQAFQRKLSRLARLTGVEYDHSSSALLGTMQDCLLWDDPAAALQHYERAVTSHIALGPKHVAVAVTACLRHEGIEQAQILVGDAQSRGIDVEFAVAHLLTKQIENSSNVPIKEVRDLVIANITSLEALGIGIDQSIITHTMHLLVRHGEASQAIDFWSVMAERYKPSATTFELETLMVILQAYRALQDPNGVDWITRMLLKSGLIPDQRFKHQAQMMLKKAAQGEKPSYAAAYIPALKDLVSTILEIRKRHELEKGDVQKMALTMLTQERKHSNGPTQSGSDADCLNIPEVCPAIVL
jgi:hypothetical protein